MNPPIPPAEIAAVVLGELLFGIGFNRLVAWAHDKKLWPVAFSVVVGVAVTVGAPALIWHDVALNFMDAALLQTACFAASGAPMVIGSVQRTAEASHKRRPWPTAAAAARDAAVMDLNLLADRVAEQQIENVQVVNNLHRIIGTLKSVP